MFLLAEQEVVIERPVPEVFGFVCNMEHFPAWFPGVLAMESADALPHGHPGKTYAETVATPLHRTTKISIRVKEVRLNEWFVTEARFPPLMPRMEIALASRPNGACHLIWRMYSRNTKPLTRLLLLPLARRVLRRRALRGVANLKTRLEAGYQPDRQSRIVSG